MYGSKQKAAKAILNKRQMMTMGRHASHHSKKHMKEMKSAMKQGATFGEAHKQALKKVGK